MTYPPFKLNGLRTTSPWSTKPLDFHDFKNNGIESSLCHLTIFTFAASRLYGQRGSISVNEAAEGRKRKRSIKFWTASEYPESNGAFLDQNGGTLGATKSGDTHVALTEITSPEALQRYDKGSPITHEDVEEATGGEDVNVEVESTSSQAEQCDETSIETQESNVEVKDLT